MATEFSADELLDDLRSANQLLLRAMAGISDLLSDQDADKPVHLNDDYRRWMEDANAHLQKMIGESDWEVHGVDPVPPPPEDGSDQLPPIRLNVQGIPPESTAMGE